MIEGSSCIDIITDQAPSVTATCRHPIAAQGGSVSVGERGRNRTYNLLIKSQLLCQLSYAPILLNPIGLSCSFHDPRLLPRGEFCGGCAFPTRGTVHCIQPLECPLKRFRRR